MKSHSPTFKTKLKDMGRQVKATITYNNTTLEDEIYSVTPHFQANLLKSCMKQLDIESSVNIPLNTVINCQIGLKMSNNNYTMLNYGNYIVYSSVKQEDTNTYKIICYDKMLLFMKDYEPLNLTYPATILEIFVAIADKFGLDVQRSAFYNSTLQVPEDLYQGLFYTYRDILDEIAEATGSIICINMSDELAIIYPTATNDTINEEYLKDVNINFSKKYRPNKFYCFK